METSNSGQPQTDGQTLKTEPFIMLYGRNIDVIQILCDELAKYGRQVAGTDSHVALGLVAAKKKVDLIVVGAGLPDKERDGVVEAVHALTPELPVHLIPRSSDPSPWHMVEFTNRKAVEWKVEQALTRQKAQAE